jgi:hypothetical protein
MKILNLIDQTEQPILLTPAESIGHNPGVWEYSLFIIVGSVSATSKLVFGQSFPPPG